MDGNLEHTNDFHSRAHLFARHPELVDSMALQAWLVNHRIANWFEDVSWSEGSKQGLVIQATDGVGIFAALLETPPDTDGNCRIVKQLTLVSRPAEERNIAVSNAISTLDRPADVLSVQPIVDFQSESIAGWLVRAASSGGVATIRLNTRLAPEGVEEHEFDIDSLEKSDEEPIPPASDETDANECHDLGRYRSTAQSWVAGATTTSDKARKIFNKVRAVMKYDGSITHISEFIWADRLVIDQLGYRGICDEWAVVQITMLRAVGIPASLRFLIFDYQGEKVGHACLEWKDGSAWRHMDALWNGFDNRAVYRQNGGANVTVMDATYPLDSRSTQPAWGVPDPTGDLKLHPYKDFVLNPTYPGNQRAGYSF